MSHALSKLLTTTFDVMTAPFSGNGPVALVTISVLCGAVMIGVFRLTSNQARIRRARDRFKAHILEMRIYQDDLVLMVRALGGALHSQGDYLRASWKSLAALAAIALVVLVQLDARFGRAPFEPGDRVIVTLRLADDADVMRTPIESQVTSGTIRDGPPVRSPASGQVSFRFRVNEPGRHAVVFSTNGHSYSVDLEARSGVAVKGRVRGQSWADALLHPGLPQLSRDGPLARVEVAYPEPAGLPWLLVFLAGSLFGALVPKLWWRIEV